jgi:hypothetical protein
LKCFNMPTVSYKEPTKEFQDIKPWMKKWRYEGPLPLIYLVLPAASWMQI